MKTISRSVENPTGRGISRRRFIRAAGTGIAGLSAVSAFPAILTKAPADDFIINIGVIGCGGRGTGAVLNALNAATNVIYPLEGYHTEDATKNAKATAKNINVVALADAFPDRLNGCREQLKKVGVEVNEKNCFTGFDAYKKLLDIKDINYVIMATPPHFRPSHLRAGIEAGKNVFIEKPCAVDATGVRSVAGSGELAKQKGLAIGAGTQRRREIVTREMVKRIHDGEIGDIVSVYSEFLIGGLWSVDRQPGWSDMEYQLRNWLYYTYLGGDHFVEQYVHTIDLVNWIMGSHPAKAVALGGRQVRTDPKFGNIYDHMSIQYEFPDGVMSCCMHRQINGCISRIRALVSGSEGRAVMGYPNTIEKKGGDTWRFRGEENNAYETEHEEIIGSIRAGKPVNEAAQVAESTLTAIMGREACYSGKEITWEQISNSRQDFTLKEYRFGDMPVPGVAMPGKYVFS